MCSISMPCSVIRDETDLEDLDWLVSLYEGCELVRKHALYFFDQLNILNGIP